MAHHTGIPFLFLNFHHTVALLGEYVQFNTPCDSDPDTLSALESQLDCPSNTLLKPETAWSQRQQVRLSAVRVHNPSQEGAANVPSSTCHNSSACPAQVKLQAFFCQSAP